MQSGEHPIEAEDADIIRSHPWNVSATNPNHRYYDFRKSPEFIPHVLEDFIQWSDFLATQTFYEMLRWINGNNSVFESNDSAFSGPHPNKSPNVPFPTEVSGRLMILFRKLEFNTLKPRVEWLKNAIHHYLAQGDGEFDLGFVGTTLMAAKYVELDLPDEKKLGFQLKLTFWAWGNDAHEAMENLNRLFLNLHSALRGVSNEVEQSLRKANE